MKLPEKYRGATEGPWVQQGFYGTTDHLQVNGANGKFVAIVRAERVEHHNTPNGRLETDYVRSAEQFANERIIRDAWSNAVRVNELEEILAGTRTTVDWSHEINQTFFARLADEAGNFEWRANLCREDFQRKFSDLLNDYFQARQALAGHQSQEPRADESAAR
ncbi:hypothetical protein [Methylorubrum sp. SB2]|uniref:hypothetical protein n=1 Tax=Methylorubrum subtropicum TaxID=3138812 RepID=UPI00313E055F